MPRARILLLAVPALVLVGYLALMGSGGPGGTGLVLDGGTVSEPGDTVDAAYDVADLDDESAEVQDAGGESGASVRTEAVLGEEGPGVIAGKVVDALGTGLGEADVELFAGGMALLGERREPRRPVQRTRSDDAGRFCFEGLESGEFTLLASKPRRASVFHSLRLQNRSLEQVGLRLVLTEASRIEGRVVDSEGRPLPGAWVLAAPQSGDWRIMDRFQLLSDAEGRFRFEDLPLVPHHLVAWKQGYMLGYEAQIQPWEDKKEHEIRLLPASDHVLEILVKHKDEEDKAGDGGPGTATAPAADRVAAGNNAVEAVTTGEARTNPWTSVRLMVSRQASNVWFPLPGPLGRPELDAEGKATIEGLPDGAYNVAAFSEVKIIQDAWKQTNLSEEVKEAKLEFVVIPSIRLEGRVVDAETKRPVPGIHLLTWVRRSWGQMVPTVTDAEGRFVFDDGFKPKDKVNVQLDEVGMGFVQGNGLRNSARIEVGKEDQVLELRRVPTLSGRVLGPDGEPVEGATVTLNAVTKKGKQQRGTARSGRDGGFELTPNAVTNDPLELSGRAEDLLGETELPFGLIERGQLPTVVLRLGAGAVLAGRVVDPERNGVPGAYVNLTRPEPGQKPGNGLQGWGRGGFTRSARTDSEGRWRFGGLEAGTYGLQVWATGFVRPAQNPSWPLARAQVRDDVELVLGRGLEITGVVRSNAGKRFQGGFVTATGPATGPEGQPQTNHAMIDADGKFKLAGLIPGLHSLRVNPPWKLQNEWRKRDKQGNRPPTPPQPQAREVAAGAEGVELVYDMPRYGALSFAVRGRGATPTEVRVKLDWLPKQSWTGKYSPRDGQVRIERFLPIRAKMRVLVAGYHPYERDVEVLPEQENDLGIVQLEPLPRLEAFVTDMAGQALADVEIGVSSGLQARWKYGGSDALVMALSDSRGRFELESPDGKTLRYHAFKPGYLPASGQLKPGKDGRLVLELRPTAEVLVHLPPGADHRKRDGKDWRPIVRIQRLDPPAPGKKPWRRTERFQREGFLRLTGLPPGNYQVDVIDQRRNRDFDNPSKDGHLLRRILGLQVRDSVELRIP